jgi:DNA repair protein RadC
MQQSIDFLKVCEVTLSYSHKVPAKDRPKISDSKSAYNVLIQLYPPEQIELKEFFYVIFLNKANQVTGYHKLSEGGIASTVVDMRLLFSAALKQLACAMILSHNHPSGNLQPSAADKELTDRAKQCGNILDIAVLDHIIITSDNGYYSFADEGRM